jgi:SAM-dependent methyltransferase
VATVYVTFLMDTEGPCADPDLPELNATWERVDASMDKLFAPEWRADLPDPHGGALKVGWFFLTWTGFRTNPRARPFGYHQVRDHWLERWGRQLAEYGDEQCWHYHHPSESGVGNEWGLDWTRFREYEQIMSRQILERDWMPACYRAGGTIMDNISSAWVDSWFPIDYSNRAPKNVHGLVDWSSGVARWTVYHPDLEDFRRPGAGRRHMARSLDRRSNVHILTRDDVTSAFEQAAAGEDAILSCFDHDSRDIADGVHGYRELVHEVAALFPRVDWRYAGPVEAVARYVGSSRRPRLELDASVVDGVVYISSSVPIFQSFPWLSYRGRGDEVVHALDDIMRLDERHWRWTPARDLEWSELGAGASTDLGEEATIRITPEDGPGVAFRRRPLSSHPTRPSSIWEYSKLFPELCAARASGRAEEMDSARQAREILAERLARESSVLDVGCAAGHLWRSLAPLGLDYHGIDPYERGIEIGRQLLSRDGLEPDRLRALSIEELPRDERYDAVVSLSTLLYAGSFQEPLEIMARAARELLVVRSSFGDETEVRWLPDILLEPGYQAMRAYFNVYSRREIAEFLRTEGFDVEWIADHRQRQRHGGEPEVVGGLSLPYEFLVATRAAPPPEDDTILGDSFRDVARAWREERAGGPPV